MEQRVVEKYGLKYTKLGLVATRYSDLPQLFGNKEARFALSTESEYLKTDALIHLFFDSNGQSLLAAPPNGVPHKTYVVHIVYAKNDSVSYSVDQSGGKFEDRVSVGGMTETLAAKYETLPGATRSFDNTWSERVTLLRSSSTDIKFTISKTVLDKPEVETKVLSEVEIPVTRTYNMSFLVGFLRTDLENPTYKYVPATPPATGGTVTATDTGDRGTLSLMVTFYASPTVWLRDLWHRVCDDDNAELSPSYKRYGRNFLDDHKLSERFFFAGGVGYNEKSDLKNLFFGLTFEPIRGASLFGGWHYGKVSTYGVPWNQNVTEQQFEAYQGNEWEAGTAFGLNVDLLVVKNLFGQQI